MLPPNEEMESLYRPQRLRLFVFVGETNMLLLLTGTYQDVREELISTRTAIAIDTSELGTQILAKTCFFIYSHYLSYYLHKLFTRARCDTKSSLSRLVWFGFIV